MSHPNVKVAVIMERQALDSKWCSEKWEAKAVIPDADAGDGDKQWRVLSEDASQKQVLFTGFDITLHRDEAQGYFLNMTAPQPKVFVAWRQHNEMAVPYIVTVSYDEAARWMDSSENVDPVPMPNEIAQWLDAYVQENYKPEPKKRQRPQSFISPEKRGE
ncbi:MAG: DUF3305 domain-containing protein [Burkholderiales bacterium]